MANSINKKVLALANFGFLFTAFLLYKGGCFDDYLKDNAVIAKPRVYLRETTRAEVHHDFPVPKNEPAERLHLYSSKSMILIDPVRKAESPYKPKLVQEK